MEGSTLSHSSSEPNPGTALPALTLACNERSPDRYNKLPCAGPNGARAVLFAQLVDDPSAWPEKFPTEERQQAERLRLHRVIEEMVEWPASTTADQARFERAIPAARWEIARSVAWGLREQPPVQGDGKAILNYLQEKAPPVYDPFSGGGSIPLEAQRLGLRAYGSDVNPVAVLIGKALVEIPPKFAGLPPVNPKSQAELKRGRWNGGGAQGLAEDVRYYGQWIRDEAEKRIGHLYPKAKLKDGSDATAIDWLWARTVRSPDPAAKGAMVPLVSNFMLSTKDGKKAWAEPVIDADAPDGWRFQVKTGAPSKEREAELKQGTIGRSSGGTCILTGTSMPFSYVRNEAQSRGLGVRLMAVVAEGTRERIYLSPSEEQVVAAERAEPAWEPVGELPNNPRDFKTPNYGMKTFASLFTTRQLAALTTLSDLVAEARDKVLVDAHAAVSIDTPGESGSSNSLVRLHAGGRGATAYADAVATYLAFALSKLADRGSSICTWFTERDSTRPTFARQAIL